jgi:hypothetical protein
MAEKNEKKKKNQRSNGGWAEQFPHVDNLKLSILL